MQIHTYSRKNSTKSALLQAGVKFTIPIKSYEQEGTILFFSNPRPVLLIARENAYSKYFSEDIYKMAAEPKELMIIPNAIHVDLYDKVNVIPFEKLNGYYDANTIVH